MATRNKRKLAALNKENCEEHPTSNFAQNSNVPRSQEDYITQVSEEIERRVTKRLSQKFSRTENRILGALAHLDDFFTNPLVPGHSRTAPETSRNIFSINQGANGDDSHSNPHPEAGIFNNQMTQNSGPEDDHDTHIYIFLYCKCLCDIVMFWKKKKNSNSELHSFPSEKFILREKYSEGYYRVLVEKKEDESENTKKNLWEIFRKT